MRDPRGVAYPLTLQASRYRSCPHSRLPLKLPYSLAAPMAPGATCAYSRRHRAEAINLA